MAENTRCHNIVVLDVAGISPVTDVLVLATGTSPRQMKTVGDQIEEIAAPQGFKPLSRASDQSFNWTIIDFIDVVVHIFSPEARAYYDLDGLWGDARRVDWSPPGKKAG